MTAKLMCVGASLLGAIVGSCLPSSSNDDSQASAAGNGMAAEATGPAADVALEIAINQFPSGYQGRWARSAAACSDDPENSENIMSLQGKLVKFHESIGTMTAGKRLTSRTMEAEFEFVGEGEKWVKPMAFAMSPDLKRLTRTDRDDGTRVQYVQCPKLISG
jgi:hypothetical protein